MVVVAITGFSGSGKTTAIETLVRHCIASGATVGVIKHTHHPINTENRGDTARFRAAGADPVVLAGDRAAAVFTGGGTRVIAYGSVGELVRTLHTDYVLIEGFKSEGDWPRIELRRGEWRAADDLIAAISRMVQQ